MRINHGIANTKEVQSPAGRAFVEAEQTRQEALSAQGKGNKKEAERLWWQFRKAVLRWEALCEEER